MKWRKPLARWPLPSRSKSNPKRAVVVAAAAQSPRVSVRPQHFWMTTRPTGATRPQTKRWSWTEEPVPGGSAAIQILQQTWHTSQRLATVQVWATLEGENRELSPSTSSLWWESSATVPVSASAGKSQPRLSPVNSKLSINVKHLILMFLVSSSCHLLRAETPPVPFKTRPSAHVARVFFSINHQSQRKSQSISVSVYFSCVFNL